MFHRETEKSGLAEHNDDCQQTIEWENTRTLAIEHNYFRRKVRESLEIRRQKTGPNDPNGINKDYGQYVKTNSWQTLFDQISDLKPTICNFTSDVNAIDANI